MAVATRPKIVLSREALIDALENRRSWAKRLDAKNLRAHQKDEQRALAAFRSALRDALKWDYAKAKAHYFQVERDRSRNQCPASVVAQLDANIKALKLDGRKTITVSDGNENSRVYWLLTHDENVKSEMC